MNKTLLLTSIAPPISKVYKTLDEEKYNWTILCIKSWQETGHDIISINTNDEIHALQNIFPEINFKVAHRSTQPINNRSLIYISDALNLAKKYPHERFSICNADVLITDSIKILENKEYINSTFFSNRINITSTESKSGELFTGIDYFNLSKKQLFEHEETLFAFGMPWWDYWFPYYSIVLNYKLFRLVNSMGSPILLHKKHIDAWNPQDLCNLGYHFFELMHNQGILPIRSNLLEIIYKENRVDLKDETINFYASLARHICTYIHEKSVSVKI